VSAGGAGSNSWPFLEGKGEKGVKERETGFLVVLLHISFSSKRNPVSYPLPAFTITL
jgi:hypothetical protein